MKKMVLLLVMVLGIHTANAQLTDIYIDDGIELTNNQWHYENLSIVAANNNRYLVISPDGYYYATLPPLPYPSFLSRYSDVMCAYSPYVHAGTLGWYIRGERYRYFYRPDGTFKVLALEPILRDIHYTLQHLRYLNMRYWHWAPRPPRPQPPYRHYAPRPTYRPPQPPHQNPPHSGYQPPRQNTRPSSQPPRQNAQPGGQPPRQNVGKPNNQPPRQNTRPSSQPPRQNVGKPNNQPPRPNNRPSQPPQRHQGSGNHQGHQRNSIGR